MKFIYLALISVLFASCYKQGKITGTASNMDGGMVSIIDTTGATISSAIIKSGKFDLKAGPLPGSGYYTLSVLSGKYPRDFEVYFEPEKDYIIGVPEKETDYLKIKTTSEIQNKLSAYYNFEDSLLYKYRNEINVWTAKLNSPDINNASDAEVNHVIESLRSAQARAKGGVAASMDMYIKEHPQTDIIPHIISNMDYQKNPLPYYFVYKELSAAAKNSSEGKQIGEKLLQLVNQMNEKEAQDKTQKPQPVSK